MNEWIEYLALNKHVSWPTYKAVTRYMWSMAHLVRFILTLFGPLFLKFVGPLHSPMLLMGPVLDFWALYLHLYIYIYTHTLNDSTYKYVDELFFYFLASCNCWWSSILVLFFMSENTSRRQWTKTSYFMLLYQRLSKYRNGDEREGQNLMTKVGLDGGKLLLFMQFQRPHWMRFNIIKRLQLFLALLAFTSKPLVFWLVIGK